MMKGASYATRTRHTPILLEYLNDQEAWDWLRLWAHQDIDRHNMTEPLGEQEGERKGGAPAATASATGRTRNLTAGVG
jgi:hypothetical protein